MVIMFLMVFGSSIRLNILVGLLRYVKRFWNWSLRWEGIMELRVFWVSCIKEEAGVVRLGQVIMCVRFSVEILHDGQRSFV